MAKLNLIRNTAEEEQYKLTVWNDEVGEGDAPMVVHTRFPCLIKAVPIRYTFNLRSIGMLIVKCTREEAKRIVYPKTNRNRCQLGFTIIEGQNLMAAMDEHIKRTIKLSRDPHLDFTNPIQRAMIDSAISDLDGVSGLVLVISRIYTTVDKLKLIDFYTVDELAARNLVYLNKGPSTKLKRLYPELKCQRAKAKSIGKRVQEIELDFSWFTQEYKRINDTE